MSKTNETGPPAITLRLLLSKEDGLWIAQCLEYDIVAQGHTLRDVKYEFEKLLVGNIVAHLENGLEPFANTPKAPSETWTIFLDSSESLDVRADWPEFRLPPGIPPAYQIPSRPSEVRVH